MAELPRIISVDDHVVEPPELWQERLPAAMRYAGTPHRAAQAEAHRAAVSAAPTWASSRTPTASGATSGSTTTSSTRS